MMIEAWKSVSRPLIGMLHAPPLPGSPRFEGGLDAVYEHVLHDAAVLEQAGFHGLMLENFGDAPFYPGRVPVETVTHLTALAAAVRRQSRLPLGINVLRNDGVSALAIAHAVRADFIRVNVFCGARVTDQGVLQGIAHELLRARATLRAGHIRIFADASVKHSAPLGPPRPLEEEVEDMVRRGGADAIVMSGAGTGKPTDLEQVRRARAAAKGCPVLIGSGITAETIANYRDVADGYIVGTSLKPGGDARAPIDPGRASGLVAAWRAACGNAAAAG
jgi:membrane complex biogenesis BtpA family protein